MDQTNETRLGSAPLGKLLFQLGLPGVAAQVINVLYNICLLYTSDAADE